jgi:endoglucanase
MLRRAAIGMAITMTLTMSGCASSSAPQHSQQPGSPAADRFLSRYVTADGRVLRHDQGDDIVSEGQAYGMLIAELAGRPSVARTIWSWTAAHLQRDDGLLSYHATGSGQVLDDEPASDADVLAAYALLRYSGPDASRLHTAGKRLAAAVLSRETVDTGGAPVLVAGPWARTAPPTVNPSYLMPGVFAALGHLTDDRRWQQLAARSVRLVGQLTEQGRTLPTDWARLADDRLEPIGAPDGSAPTQYGLDASRVPMWFGTACEAPARELAARWWTNELSHDTRAADLALSPDGAPINQDAHPLPLLAGAAAARAADDTAASRSLRAKATRQSRTTSTYYGDAWLALGGALLDETLDPCEEANRG